jgi:hypothetical protein
MRAGRTAPSRALAIPISLAIAFSLLASCGASGGLSKAERKARLERAAQAEAEKGELERKLAAASSDLDRLACLRSIMAIEVMRTGELDSAMGRFAKDRALLEADAMSRIYLAVAQSMKAGQVKKIEDKLAWLRRGMSGFDELREEYPDDIMVPLYQASTYANFPREVGARDEVLDILDGMRSRCAKGDWELGEGAAGQVAYVYATLGRAYPDAESSAAIGAGRSAFARDVPALARELAAADGAARAATGAAR